MILDMGDNVVGAWAETCHGPGWTNYPIWVLIRKPNGEHRIDCIQPESQTDSMLALFTVSEAAHRAMTGEVRASLVVTHA